MNSTFKLIINSNYKSKIINFIINRNTSEWHLLSAVCVQRVPQISPEMNWLDTKVANIMSRVEVNHSLYSDHEMRHFEDL